MFPNSKTTDYFFPGRGGKVPLVWMWVNMILILFPFVLPVNVWWFFNPLHLPFLGSLFQCSLNTVPSYIWDMVAIILHFSRFLWLSLISNLNPLPTTISSIVNLLSSLKNSLARAVFLKFCEIISSWIWCAVFQTPAYKSHQIFNVNCSPCFSPIPILTLHVFLYHFEPFIYSRRTISI